MVNLSQRKLKAAITAAVSALLLNVGSAPTRTAEANGSSTLVHILCVPELGYLKLAAIGVSGDAAIAGLAAHRDEVEKEYGLYGPGAYFDFGGARSGDRVRAVTTRKATSKCDLGKNIVDIAFEPEWLAPDFSYRLTVHIDGLLVMSTFASTIVVAITMEFRDLTTRWATRSTGCAASKMICRHHLSAHIR